MTLDEAINHAEEVAEEKEIDIENQDPLFPNNIEECKKCAEEHRQLAEWLKELKHLREQTTWIPCSERLPKTDNKNEINEYNVLLWVANKTHPERESQIYLGKLKKVNGDDGSGNFWGIETKPCDWTIWGWSYFNEPEVIAWMPLPQPYKAESGE